MDFTPNREELAWAAGFFDGEGYVGANRKKGRNWPLIEIAITQIDRRVLDRFAAAVGLGKVYGPYNPQARANPLYRYHEVRHERVQAIGAMLWQWLSPVKRNQFRGVLTGPLRRPFCQHHLIKSHCRECLRAPATERMRRWRANRKLAVV